MDAHSREKKIVAKATRARRVESRERDSILACLELIRKSLYHINVLKNVGIVGYLPLKNVEKHRKLPSKNVKYICKYVLKNAVLHRRSYKCNALQ